MRRVLFFLRMQCARTWVLIEAWLLRVAVHAGRPLVYDDERVEFAPSDDKQAEDMSDMSNDVSAPRTPVKTALGEKKLARIAKRMLLRYDKAVLKASMHAAPHGYGDGFSECMCRRCERALWYQEAASEARAVWCIT